MNLTNQQFRVLAELAQVKNPLSRQEISDRCFNGNSVNFSPILGPMVVAGIVEERKLDIDGKIETDFEVTVAGLEIASTAGTPSTARVGRSATDDESVPQVGDSFFKEWHGETFQVEVVEGGYEVLGEHFSSLTAAAKFIRGDDVSVNGWAFFGFR